MHVKNKVVLADVKVYTDHVSYGFKRDPRESADGLVKIAKDYDKIIRGTSKRINKSSVSIGYTYVEKFFASSNGARILQEYVDTVAEFSATAHESGLTQNVSGTEGGRGGIEMLTEYVDVYKSAENVAQKSSLIDARPIKEQGAGGHESRFCGITYP